MAYSSLMMFRKMSGGSDRSHRPRSIGIGFGLHGGPFDEALGKEIAYRVVSTRTLSVHPSGIVSGLLGIGGSC